MRKLLIILFVNFCFLSCNSDTEAVDSSKPETQEILGKTYGIAIGDRYNSDTITTLLKVGMGVFQVNEVDKEIYFGNTAGMIVHNRFSISSYTSKNGVFTYQIEMTKETAEEWNMYREFDFFHQISDSNGVLTRGEVKIFPKDSTVLIGWFVNDSSDYFYYEKYLYNLEWELTRENIGKF